jgi:hypothetical protein
MVTDDHGKLALEFILLIPQEKVIQTVRSLAHQNGHPHCVIRIMDAPLEIDLGREFRKFIFERTPRALQGRQVELHSHEVEILSDVRVLLAVDYVQPALVKESADA